jgi:hypothetical protein
MPRHWRRSPHKATRPGRTRLIPVVEADPHDALARQIDGFSKAFPDVPRRVKLTEAKGSRRRALFGSLSPRGLRITSPRGPAEKSTIPTPHRNEFAGRF